MYHPHNTFNRAKSAIKQHFVEKTSRGDNQQENIQ